LSVNAGNFRWQVAPGLQHLLFGPSGLRLEEWRESGRARVVKHGPHRTVYHVELPGFSFYLKHFHLPDVRTWLRQLVRPAKARMEFERALAIAERHVPTVTPVAMGERRNGPVPGESFLITHGLENTEALSAFLEITLPRLEPVRRAGLRQRIAKILGEFAARLHDAGILHRDLHAANLLVHLDEGDQPHLFLIDLHAVYLGRPLSWRASCENLAMLNRWFILRASRADRQRFWRAYWQARAAGHRPWHTDGFEKRMDNHWPPASELARDLEVQTWQSNLGFWRSRDRRSLVTNRYYYRLRLPVVTGHAVRDLRPEELAEFLSNPDFVFERANVKILKDSRSSTVAEFDLIVNGSVRRVIYKRFRVTRWTDPWAALLRQPPALRSWIFGHGLRERHLPTARPLAVFHRRAGCLWQEGYLLAEKIPDAVDLHIFLARLSQVNAAERRDHLRRQVDQLASLVHELHRRQLSHRDLKAGNLLAAQGKIWLIDLVGVRQYHKLTRNRCVQNMARLHASFHQHPCLTRTDKLRFLRTYLRWGLRGNTGWKEWWQQIEAATQAKIARNLRSGRPLA
jgi:tRNA A-37 threonylcarbamoyl transferase component Bud32